MPVPAMDLFHRVCCSLYSIKCSCYRHSNAMSNCNDVFMWANIFSGVSIHSAQQCSACKRVRKVALMRMLRLKNKARRPLLHTARKRLRYAVRTLRRRNKKVQVLRSNLERLQEESSATEATVLEKKVAPVHSVLVIYTQHSF